MAAKKETKEKAPAKKQSKKPEIKWSKGWPKVPGLYKVKADGKEKILRHSVCELTGKHRWMEVTGYDAMYSEVLFVDKKITLEDL